MLTRRAARRPPSWKSWTRALATTTGSTSQLEVADPLLLYQSLVTQGKLRKDHEQLRALVQMRKLHAELLDYQPPIRLITLLESLRASTDPQAVAEPPPWPFQRSILSTIGRDLLPAEEEERASILALSEKAKSKQLVQVLKEEHSLEALDTPRGFLLTGAPGTGKSVLMDIFFNSLPVPHKVRFHYHHFLLSVYSRVHEALEKQRFAFEAEEKAMNEKAGVSEEGYSWSRREEMKALAITKGWRAVFAGGRSPNDPDLNVQEFVLVGIARDLIKTHGWLLAFDEVQLVDIAGAGLINRVLSWYWRLGGVVIGTSNRVPEDLYNSGVQKESINSFLVALASRSPVIELDSPLDYRRETQRGALLPSSESDLPPGDFGAVEAWHRLGSRAKGWYVKGQEREFQQTVDALVGDGVGCEQRLRVYGRDLVIPWSFGGVARFTFHELCEKALGPADYISLASAYHTVIITGVPILKLNAKNEARRLITLLDSLYETKTRALVMAETDVDSLFFPDAVAGTSLSQPTFDPSPDDIVSHSGSSHPFSSSRIYDDENASSPSVPSHSAFLQRRQAVDPAGEIGDSLTEEMLGDVMQDLEAPYRPNVSLYDAAAGTALYSADEARIEKAGEAGKWKSQQGGKKKQATPHPSAATPAFQSLAIFTGEEERFAFKRAVSRVHEMSSQEFLRTAIWTPLDPSFRTWERPSKIAPLTTRPTSSKGASEMGPSFPLTGAEEKLSGVLSPTEIRLRFPDGMPKHNEVDVSRKSLQQQRKRGEKKELEDVGIDPRLNTVPPKLAEAHVWGVREDWGKGAGQWGKGAKAYDQEEGLDGKKL